MNGDDVRNGVIRYWQVFTVIGVFLVGWGTLKTEVSGLQQAVADEKQTAREQTEKQNNVEKSIVRIETKQERIRQDVDEIKESQKAQSKKLDEILRKLNE